jgi:hypothetical protein
MPSMMVLSSETIACLAWESMGILTFPFLKERPLSEFLLTSAESTTPNEENNLLTSESVVLRLIFDIRMSMRDILVDKYKVFNRS